jgi:hypothetical protein
MAETCSCSTIRGVVLFDGISKYLSLSRLFITDTALCTVYTAVPSLYIPHCSVHRLYCCTVSLYPTLHCAPSILQYRLFISDTALCTIYTSVPSLYIRHCTVHRLYYSTVSSCPTLHCAPSMLQYPFQTVRLFVSCVSPSLF